MNPEEYLDAALVLVGHGSTLNEESAATVYQHAAILRARHSFAEVREAFWKQEPGLVGVLRSITAPRVFIIPLFISEGYFSEVIIPCELGFRRGGGGEFRRVMERGQACAFEPDSAALVDRNVRLPMAVGCSRGQTLFYGRPVGTHDRMTEAILDRARGITRQFPFPRAPQEPDITLFIAGHGTGQSEKSRKSIERQVELIREMGFYNAVHGVFMEEEPRIERCYEMASTNSIVVVPFFMSDGLHVKQDIPVLLGEPESVVRERLAARQPPWRNPSGKRSHLVWYAPSVGSDPVLAEVILARVGEAASFS